MSFEAQTNISNQRLFDARNRMTALAVTVACDTIIVGP